MAAFSKKVDVLFTLNILSDNFFDNDEDKEEYAATIKEYFGKAAMKRRQIQIMKKVCTHCAVP